MNRIASLAAVAAIASVASGPSTAQEVVDLSSTTCAEVMNIEDPNLIFVLVAWADGYVSGRTGDTRFDIQLLQNLAAGLDDVCSANPDATFVSAIESLL